MLENRQPSYISKMWNCQTLSWTFQTISKLF